MKLPLTFSVIVLILVLGGFFFSNDFDRERPPRPRSDDSELQENSSKLGRREWFEKLHFSDNEVDWREIERENWKNHLETRNRLINQKKPSATGDWQELGSNNQAGRTYATAFSSDGSEIFVGSALGGIWKADVDPGAPDFERLDWQPIGDGVFGGASQVLIMNDGSIIIGAEDIHVTRNQGQTWQPISEDLDRVRRLIMMNDANETVFASGHQWLWSDNQWNRTTTLYRSDDRGHSFQEINVLGFKSNDIWTSRLAQGPLYTLADNRFKVSTDLGETWTTLSTLPGPTRHSALAGSQAGEPTFYAALTEEGKQAQLFRSDDGGHNWLDLGVLEESLFGGVWNGFRSLDVSPSDPSLVFYGDVNTYRSSDSGVTFQMMNHWTDYIDQRETKLHADLPGLNFVNHPNGQEYIFFNTDGGTYVSVDEGKTVQNISLENLNISQYYDILTDQNDPTQIFAGSQDQGYQYAQLTNLDDTNAFEILITGDYGHLVSGDNSHALVYSVYPTFVLVTYEDALGSVNCCIRIYFPEDGTFRWLPFLMADLEDNETFNLCGSRIYRHERSGNRWIATALPHDFSGGRGNVVSALAMAPNQTDRWYAVTDEGLFWVSDDRGQVWQNRSSGLPAAHRFYGSYLWVSPDDWETLVVAGSGYDNSGVWISRNGGESFMPLGINQPETLFFELTQFDVGHGIGDFYGATESGPYRYDVRTDSWESILGTEAPMTSYWCVETVGNAVRFGTYGRGIWEYRPAKKRDAISIREPRTRVSNRRNQP